MSEKESPPCKKAKWEPVQNSNSQILSTEIQEIEYIEIKEEEIDNFYSENEINQLEDSTTEIDIEYDYLDLKRETEGVEIEFPEQEADPSLNSEVIDVGESTSSTWIRFVYQTSCCKQNCHLAFDEDMQQELFKSFWDTNNKQMQDTFLIGCVMQRQNCRPIPKTKIYRRQMWEYFLSWKKDKISVCKQFLLQLLQISEGRMKTVLRFCQAGQNVATEQRGIHLNRPRRTPLDVRPHIRQHWALFPHTVEPNSRRKYFVNPDLTIIKLYDLFKEYYVQKTGKKLQLAYSSYNKHFRDTKEYFLAEKKSEQCEFCTECRQRLFYNPSHSCNRPYSCHVATVQKYTQLKDSTLSKVQGQNSFKRDQLVLEFNFVPGFQLPKAKTPQHFYLNLLSVHMFNIHSYDNYSGAFYCLPECDGAKDANAICSFLYDFLSEKLQERPEVRRVVLISNVLEDVTVVRFLAFLAVTLNVTFVHIFEPQGHGYGECEKNAVLYSSVMRKVTCVEHINDYLNVIKKVRRGYKPFRLKMGGSVIRKWDRGLAELYGKKKLSPEGFVKFRYSPDGKVSFHAEYDDEVGDVREAKLEEGFWIKLQTAKPPGLSIKKKADLYRLVDEMKAENQKWFRKILKRAVVFRTRKKV